MRTIFRITGADRLKFLDGLITNKVPETGLGYAALLTPQGKYLADFFVWRDDDAVFLDVASEIAQDTGRRLMMYRLRSDVSIEDSGLQMSRGTSEERPEGAMSDPRHAGLGWRAYGTQSHPDDTDWDALRVELVIPETGHELIPNESYILEMDFERLNGVDFRKGCYVGQEIVARMKHKTELRKGLARVTLDGPAEEGAELTADGKPAGVLHTIAGAKALAYLRFDRARGSMQAGAATVLWED